jgi:hypothetical protein
MSSWNRDIKDWECRKKTEKASRADIYKKY